MKSRYSRSVCKDILRSPLFVAVLSSLTVHSVYCACGNNDTVVYAPIPVQDYDRNYSSISSIDKYPLGFKKGIWYYENEDHPNPCFKITGAANRRIEIMYETFPKTRLCIRFQGSVICSESGTGELYRCLPSQGSVEEVEFFCDSQCIEEDIRFWYRFVLGDVEENDKEDRWCDGRNQAEYPENLRQLPPNFPINPDTTTPAGKAAYLSNSVLAYLFVMCLHIFF